MYAWGGGEQFDCGAFVARVLQHIERYGGSDFTGQWYDRGAIDPGDGD